jgi:hypothetical protein
LWRRVESRSTLQGCASSQYRSASVADLAFDHAGDIIAQLASAEYSM